MPENNPHPQYRQDRCEHCAAGVPMCGPLPGDPGRHHVRPEDHYYVGEPCTAPTADAYIAELLAKLANAGKWEASYLADNATLTKQRDELRPDHALLEEAQKYFAQDDGPGIHPDFRTTLRAMIECWKRRRVKV